MTRRLPGVLGICGVLAVAGGLAASTTVLPSLQRTALTGVGELPVSRTTPSLVCPGPETLLVPDGGTAVDPGGAVLISSLVAAAAGPSSARVEVLGKRSESAVTAGRTLPSGLAAPADVVRARSQSLTSDDSGPVTGTLAVTALGPAVLGATSANIDGSAPADPSADADPPSLAALQSTVVRSGDLRGLTTTTCSVPASDSWLVGGSTVEGERLRLLLANPAATPAVVDIDVHGPEGRVRAASGEGVLVPAGGQVPIFVDALVPGLERVAVRVTTRSGRVRATLHDSRLRGLVPGGADDVPVGAAPARRQVLPGISLVNGYGKSADDPTAAGSTAVRVAVPGAEEAVVRIRMLDSSGSVELPRVAVLNVPAGGVVDVPVAGIPSGTYTAVVEADVPVVAGALVGRGGVAGTEPASEFAWAAAARPLEGSGYVVLPPAARSALSMVAVERASRLTVTPVRSDGSFADPVVVGVPGGTSATLQLGSGTVAVLIDELGGGPVAASVVSWVTDARGSLISVPAVSLSTSSTPPRRAVQDRTLGLR